MQSFAIAIVAVAFVLGVMIVIHELGHHLVAKWFGVRVETFSVGFGKRLAGFRMGETDYRVSALPFGGYVKMAGENPMEARTGDPGEFMSHPRWQRVLIALAGPTMNIILAVGLLTAVFMIDYSHPAFTSKPVQVSYVMKDSAGAAAGIQPGDRITRLGNITNPTWEDLRLSTVLGTREAVPMTIVRDGKEITESVKPDAPGPNENDFGLVPQQQMEITEIKAGMPLYVAGGRMGDIIKSVDGHTFDSVPRLQDYLAKGDGAPVTMTLQRGAQTFDIKVTPIMSDDGGIKRFRLGFLSNPVIHDRLPFGKAVDVSIQQNKKFAFLIVEMVQKMAERKVSMKQLDGPVRIAQLSGEAASAPGWTPLMLLMAAISLNLGILNLLPIPILDGGLILLTLIESVIRRDIDQRVKERIYQTAFVFLVMFAVAVVYNDVHKMLFPS